MKENVKKRLSNHQIITLSFLVVIVIGALLLSLPISSSNGVFTPFLDSLFTSTSSVCVTGLVVYDTFNHWSVFGRILIILMIQIGGLGLMTIVTLVSMLLGKKIDIHERKLATQSSGSMSEGKTLKLIRKIVFGCLSIEALGALFLSFRFCNQFGFWKGIGFSVFHSVSAFCNAGFDLMGGFGDFSSFVPFSGDYFVISVIMILVVVGGIGFIVWEDIIKNRLHFSKYSLHSKIVLITTISLILSGFVLFFILEYNNTLDNMSIGKKILSAMFLSVSPRTAGFNTVPMTDLTDSSKLITVILMLIGGSPGSTAGGMKTTTIAVTVLCTITAIKGRSNTEVFKRKLADEFIRQAVAIFTVYIFVVCVSTVLISAVQGFEFVDVLYEVASAAGTVGLSAGLTTKLNEFSKVLIMILMFMGRIGILTFAMALGEKKVQAPIARPVEKIMLG